MPCSSALFGEAPAGQHLTALLAALPFLSRRCLSPVPQTKNGEANMKREVQCIKKLKHPNIIQLIDVIDMDDHDHVYLVFELANFKSIREASRRFRFLFSILSCMGVN